ncbi:MAG: hypothetical protein RLZZ569_996 [Bacteroidota bacterium]
MNHQNLIELTEIVKASNEAISVDLDSNRLVLKTKKNELWIALSVMTIALSLLLIFNHASGKYNLEIGLVLLWISIGGFWRMQNINKTLIIDLSLKTITIIPDFFLQRFFCQKILKVQPTFSFSNLPELKLLFYTNLKYHWTHRIYFKKGFWTIYLLEFEKSETAQQVLSLLQA